jgi:hypothetical protein
MNDIKVGACGTYRPTGSQLTMWLQEPLDHLTSAVEIVNEDLERSELIVEEWSMITQPQRLTQVDS